MVSIISLTDSPSISPNVIILLSFDELRLEEAIGFGFFNKY
jgi:hypothetical protein